MRPIYRHPKKEAGKSIKKRRHYLPPCAISPTRTPHRKATGKNAILKHHLINVIICYVLLIVIIWDAVHDLLRPLPLFLCRSRVVQHEMRP